MAFVGGREPRRICKRTGGGLIDGLGMGRIMEQERGHAQNLSRTIASEREGIRARQDRTGMRSLHLAEKLPIGHRINVKAGQAYLAKLCSPLALRPSSEVSRDQSILTVSDRAVR